jgi:hypothetical protein
MDIKERYPHLHRLEFPRTSGTGDNYRLGNAMIPRKTIHWFADASGT